MSTKRDQILDAADRLFGEVGYDAATTRQIAEACGVTKALIHYHFPSKEVLFRCVLDRYYDRLETVLQGVLLQGGTDLAERFEALIDAYVDFLVANKRFSRMVQREAAGGALTEHIVTRMAPTFQGAVAILEHTWPATREGDLSAAQVLVSFYGMVVGWFAYAPIVAALTGADPYEPAQLAARKQHLKRMTRMVLEDLGASPQKGRE